VDTGRSKELVMKADSVIQPAHQEPEGEARAKARPVVRTATREQFDKVHKKIKTVHAGLFRRLAK
jgi:fructose-specific phosphotransferase system component IIB